MNPEKLTIRELFAIFDRSDAATRFVASADAEEYLAVVTYLVGRSNRRLSGA